MMDMHYPPDDFIGMPVSMISAILFFLIVIQSTQSLCDYCTEMAVLLTTGSFFGLNLSSAAQENPFTKVAEGGSKLMGINASHDPYTGQPVGAFYERQKLTAFKDKFVGTFKNAANKVKRGG
jgi:hypothetical protein